MRGRTIGTVAIGAMLLSACGSVGGKSASLSRPASPVYLSVYVNDSRISVSPTAVGAGPVVFVVANQSSQSEALQITRAGSSDALATTAPISPQGTTQLTLDAKRGAYTIGTAPRGATEAQLSQPSGIRAASFSIRGARAGSSNQVMQP